MLKKIAVFAILTFCTVLSAKADHITGGEIFYKYASNNNGTYTYHVTYKLFMRCNSGRQFNNPAIVSIFDRGTHQRIADLNVNLSSSETIQLTNPDPCITDPPKVCYVVGYYNFDVSLPASANGYILASQVNYRIQGINNLQNFYSNIGATYTAEIPGNEALANNSAQFTGNDLVVVCANNRFSYSFGATDADNDQLRYSFCEAYRSGTSGNTPIPPREPPYESVPYGNEFSEGAPLGKNVQIDAATGLITGIAPPTGIYVVTVCVEEIRNGQVIARQRKDLQINIAPCNIAAALLEPEYMLCKDTKTLTLSNLSSSPLIRTSYWEIANRAGIIVYSSTEPTPSFTFPDTGLYKIKLSINRGENCKDSTESIARVYPGFVPDFNFTGICFNKPTKFKDLTVSPYGIVNSWNWAFGTGDTSNLQNPNYIYTQQGIHPVKLFVSNSVGCRDFIIKEVVIVTEPPVNLAFKDTLICKGDAVTLHSNATGLFSWTPNANMTNPNTSSPTVTPGSTTLYTVNFNDNGCLNKDSVLVRVTDHVTLHLMNDTLICRGDTIRLRVQTDAFTYQWAPAAQVIQPDLPSPLAITNNRTTYSIKANIGSCVATGSVTVSTAPYPSAYAGNDTSLCYNTSGQLRGISDGSSFSWTPGFGLNRVNITNPVATPSKTTTYIFHAFDNKGCPKPGTDTVVVTVLPRVNAFAGNDTSAVIDQPLQLQASGGTGYLWLPNIGLSANNIANPIAIYNETINQIQYKVLVSNSANCIDSAFVMVKVFNTGPTVFVPSAFTPNADGKNDILRPIAVGLKEFDFFRVFNRWGQEVFSTRNNGNGWDGSINGVPQTTGTYVWWIKATDYKGKAYFKKGTVLLLK